MFRLYYFVPLFVLGSGQYRNAVASGQVYDAMRPDATALRY